MDSPKRKILGRNQAHDQENPPVEYYGNLYYALKVINLAMVKEEKVETLKNEVEILKKYVHKHSHTHSHTQPHPGTPIQHRISPPLLPFDLQSRSP